jgi:paraquat-inducible protein B
MRRSANMTLIGAFVAGGILLIITAVILLGAGSFTGSKPEAIAYFEDSVSGLDIGAPVKFRGVTIGKVSQVLLHTSGQSAPLTC